jgi:predicted enzyme related to lactoylglutathione lyase
MPRGRKAARPRDRGRPGAATPPASSSNDLRFADRTGHLIGRWALGRAISREAGLLPHIYVDGIHEAAKLAGANGGVVVSPIRTEGNLWVATISDPAGNLIGLWQEQPA